MKISSILAGLLALPAGNRSDRGCDWMDDPYAHPAIDAMSERERADLPPAHLPAAHVSRSGRFDRCIA